MVKKLFLFKLLTFNRKYDILILREEKQGVLKCLNINQNVTE